MRTARFDATDHLGTRNAQVEYRIAAYETGDLVFVRDAYNFIARTRGTKPNPGRHARS